MYHKNICCKYTLSYIITNILSCIKKCLLLYIILYNNKHFYYTSSRIMRYTSCIREIFIVIIHLLI